MEKRQQKKRSLEIQLFYLPSCLSSSLLFGIFRRSRGRSRQKWETIRSRVCAEKKRALHNNKKKGVRDIRRENLLSSSLSPDHTNAATKHPTQKTDETAPFFPLHFFSCDAVCRPVCNLDPTPSSNTHILVPTSLSYTILHLDISCRQKNTQHSCYQKTFLLQETLTRQVVEKKGLLR